MNSKIKINKVISDLDYSVIDSKYDIFAVKTDDKYFSRGSKTFDSPLADKRVLSICFESGKTFYVMFEHNSENKALIRKICDDTEDADKISIAQIKSADMDNNLLIQLLINGISSKSHPYLRFNNLTGRFYCFCPEWIIREKNSIKQIKTIEFHVNKDNILEMALRTFTSLKYKDYLKFEKKKWFEYPQYMISADNSLRRKTEADKDAEGFIMRQFSNSKNTIPFMNVQNYSKFKISKMGALEAFISAFNNKYKGFASIKLAEKEISDSVECLSQTKSKKINHIYVSEVLSEKNIRIVDVINSEDSEKFCKKISDVLSDAYEVKAKIGKRLNKEALNIRIIHNDEYYGDDIHDPHDDNLEGYSVQHITFEDFADSADKAISTVAHNLIIKDDLLKKKITLIDWSSLGYNEDIIFGTVLKEDEFSSSRYFFMTVHPDGTFDIEEKEYTFMEMDTYTELEEIFENNPSVVGIVKLNNGHTNIIKQTGMFTVPEIFAIKEQLEQNNTSIRNKEGRIEYFEAVTDIKLYKENGCQYYFAGVIGNGMNTGIDRAAKIYEISATPGSDLFFERLLELMNVLFVRNSQLTVMPFPFKYLREYIINL